MRIRLRVGTRRRKPETTLSEGFDLSGGGGVASPLNYRPQGLCSKSHNLMPIPEPLISLEESCLAITHRGPAAYDGVCNLGIQFGTLETGPRA